MKIITTKHCDYTSETLVHLSEPVYSGDLTDNRKRREMAQLAGGSLADKGNLCIGDMHDLNRQQVEKFVAHLQSWLDTGSLKIG